MANGEELPGMETESLSRYAISALSAGIFTVSRYSDEPWSDRRSVPLAYGITFFVEVVNLVPHRSALIYLVV